MRKTSGHSQASLYSMGEGVFVVGTLSAGDVFRVPADPQWRSLAVYRGGLDLISQQRLRLVSPWLQQTGAKERTMLVGFISGWPGASPSAPFVISDCFRSYRFSG